MANKQQIMPGVGCLLTLYVLCAADHREGRSRSPSNTPLHGQQQARQQLQLQLLLRPLLHP
jgi:hypothetical protein